jgi:hypothetical protein
MSCKWSKWFNPETKKPQVGLYVQIDQECFMCKKTRISEGIVTDIRGNFLKLVPNAEVLCFGIITRWRFRIDAPDIEIKRKEKVEEPV